ncbi:MAG: tRNA (adenosine(37)-N6)-threonylcarbamoyltransferase complex dimerization subunit type 1 TsaB, partial [Emcibacteraceae bacterium]|nr:tRNA (adenosine(37)-N6)-threonylcarbamoyltransferase complex dimerization subunit type 1 TsaB [Emcibacteraceae bacterium]
RLIPMIDEVRDMAQIDLTELEAIAVTIGPGTFAGVRIGLSAAKGIGLALDIPIIAVTSLEALAHEYAQENIGLKCKITICIDARRGEFYMQSFQIKNGTIVEADHAEAVPLNMMIKKINDADKIIGNGASFIENNDKVVEGYLYPKATMISKLAKSVSGKKTNPDQVSPLYLRAPDAKPPSAKDIPVIKNE